MAELYGQLVKFYNVEELCADKLAEIRNLMPLVLQSVFSIATFYRFLIPKIFSADIDKVVYLDSDLIVNLDINDLWRVELEDKPLAAVSEHEIGSDPNWFIMCHDGIVNLEDYFNAGVIVMNLNVFRAEEQNLLDGMKFIAEHPEYRFFDQDVLNYCFSTTAYKLPTKFNLLVRDLRARPDVRIEKKIYHYAAASTQLEINDPFNRLWLKYFMKTPWFDEDTIGRLYAGVQQVHMTLKRGMINTSAVMSGKTRAFYAFRQDFDALKEIFGIRKDEKILSADEPDAVEKLIKEMKKSRGKKVFFIMPPNFPFQVLADAGLTPNCDYVNGFEFLSEEQGFPLNSYELIKAI